MELIVSLVIGGVIGWAITHLYARRSSAELRAENADLRQRLGQLQDGQDAMRAEIRPLLQFLASNPPSTAELRAGVRRAISLFGLEGTIQPTGSLTTQVIRGSTSPQEPPDASRAPDAP